jgi:hypothetical protein
MSRSRKKVTFPYSYQKNGMTGKIYKIGDWRFKTHFNFAGKPHQKILPTFEKALEHINNEFNTLDSNLADSESQYPLERDRKYYHDLEQRLRLESETALLSQAVDFDIATTKKKLVPHTVRECVEMFIASRRANGAPIAQIKNLKNTVEGFLSSSLVGKFTTFNPPKLRRGY